MTPIHIRTVSEVIMATFTSVRITAPTEAIGELRKLLPRGGRILTQFDKLQKSAPKKATAFGEAEGYLFSLKVFQDEVIWSISLKSRRTMSLEHVQKLKRERFGKLDSRLEFRPITQDKKVQAQIDRSLEAGEPWDKDLDL